MEASTQRASGSSRESLAAETHKQRRNAAILDGTEAISEDGEIFTLAELSEHSLSNPTLRRGTPLRIGQHRRLHQRRQASRERTQEPVCVGRRFLPALQARTFSPKASPSVRNRAQFSLDSILARRNHRPRCQGSAMNIVASVSPSALLLEDEFIIAADIEDCLRVVGFDVSSFASCRAAHDWLITRRPDVAILDLDLPDGLCAGVATSLVEKGVPFLVHSGVLREAGSYDRILDQGIWISKPCLSSDLARVAMEAVQKAATSKSG